MQEAMAFNSMLAYLQNMTQFIIKMYKEELSVEQAQKIIEDLPTKLIQSVYSTLQEIGMGVKFS